MSHSISINSPLTKKLHIRRNRCRQCLTRSLAKSQIIPLFTLSNNNFAFYWIQWRDLCTCHIVMPSWACSPRETIGQLQTILGEPSSYTQAEANAAACYTKQLPMCIHLDCSFLLEAHWQLAMECTGRYSIPLPNMYQPATCTIISRTDRSSRADRQTQQGRQTQQTNNVARPNNHWGHPDGVGYGYIGKLSHKHSSTTILFSRQPYN